MIHVRFEAPHAIVNNEQVDVEQQICRVTRGFSTSSSKEIKVRSNLVL